MEIATKRHLKEAVGTSWTTVAAGKEVEGKGIGNLLSEVGTQESGEGNGEKGPGGDVEDSHCREMAHQRRRFCFALQHTPRAHQALSLPGRGGVHRGGPTTFGSRGSRSPTVAGTAATGSRW